MDRNHSWKRLLFIVISIGSLITVSGCWDSRDIEDISLEVASSFDMVDDDTVGESGDEQGKSFVEVTMQCTVPQQSEENADGGQKGKAYKNIVSRGRTVMEAIRKMSLEESRPPFGQHTKIVLIGEKMARLMNLQGVLSLYLHTYEIRPSANILISKGIGRHLLEVTRNTDIPGIRLQRIYQNHYKTNGILPLFTIGQTASKMASDASFLLQAVKLEKGKVLFDGGAVIKGSSKRLIGFLTREEVEGLNWLTGQAKGIVQVFDKEKRQNFAVEIKSIERTVTPYINGNKISFDVNIEGKVSLFETWHIPTDLLNEDHVKSLEKLVENEVNRLVHLTLHKMQKKYKVDVADFRDQFRISYPIQWLELKNKWDDHFRKAQINTKVNIRILDHGERGRTM
ncbi:Ger(x)C family spore germination protein [Thermoactinomyces sp. CICC 10523]|uniref:Ger(x)C family spore germination protein n=1 Tax=Thermoactinomyces sp. CICC 10523 TaxID=2767428 RepID=UPI0018DB7C4A|nr:Ger(x)C family spore germination protein [Thermoactinomyces sp. CICC 10523]MBH8599743.1 Ger(x)C family spore germination protein [Thermoactinomyces sp. CICC 10523]